jgi:hypothetical protein
MLDNNFLEEPDDFIFIAEYSLADVGWSGHSFEHLRNLHLAWALHTTHHKSNLIMTL